MPQNRREAFRVPCLLAAAITVLPAQDASAQEAREVTYTLTIRELSLTGCRAYTISREALKALHEAGRVRIEMELEHPKSRVAMEAIPVRHPYAQSVAFAFADLRPGPEATLSRYIRWIETKLARGEPI